MSHDKYKDLILYLNSKGFIKIVGSVSNRDIITLTFTREGEGHIVIMHYTEAENDKYGALVYNTEALLTTEILPTDNFNIFMKKLTSLI